MTRIMVARLARARPYMTCFCTRSEDLEEFNQQIVGKIEVVAQFHS